MKRILFFERKNYSFSKKHLTLLTIALISIFSAGAQSLTALSFDGTDDRVDLPTNVLTRSYTKEAWVYSPLFDPTFNNNNIVSGQATAFWFPGSQGFRLSAGHFGGPGAVSGLAGVQDPTPMLANTWYHVAVTYDEATTTMNLYKNGILVASSNAMPAVDETQNYIGSYIGGNYMNGMIDEVRIWSVALTQTEIRDWMLRKVTNTHPQIANLRAYYKLDDGPGSPTATDQSANGFNGVLVPVSPNGPTWVTSGAPLGDTSAHDYVNAIKTAMLPNLGATGESFTATSVTGTPDFIQVYRIDSKPTNTTGIVGLGGNNKYFGVFQSGGTNPAYDVVYNYDNSFPSNDENAFRLFTRDGNSDPTWSDAGAVQDQTANTFTAAGIITLNSEFILGSLDFPLPVGFTSFSASKEKTGVILNWSTEWETNNSGFTIQRSVDGGRNWTELGFVRGSQNSAVRSSYTYTDIKPMKGVNYYRIKQIDQNGHSKLTDIKWINYIGKAGIFLYPMPAKDQVTLDINQDGIVNTEAKLLDSYGRLVRRFKIASMQESIPLTSLAAGFYVLQLADGTSYKIVKQ